MRASNAFVFHEPHSLSIINRNNENMRQEENNSWIFIHIFYLVCSLDIELNSKQAHIQIRKTVCIINFVWYFATHAPHDRLNVRISSVSFVRTVCLRQLNRVCRHQNIHSLCVVHSSKLGCTQLKSNLLETCTKIYEVYQKYTSIVSVIYSMNFSSTFFFSRFYVSVEIKKTFSKEKEPPFGMHELWTMTKNDDKPL